MKKLSYTLFFFLALAACGDDNERPEVIDRLRTLGTTAIPLISEPSDANNARTVQLRVFVALPENETLTVEAFQDQGSIGSYTLDKDAIHPTAPVDTDYLNKAKLRLLPLAVSVDVPTAAQLDLTAKGKRIRYGLRLTGSSGRTENVVGSFLVYPAGAPELSWQAPSVALDAPADQSDVQKSKDGIELKATVTNPEEEAVKLGWFVTSGKISARRARETVWLEPSEGKQTVIVTVHGKKTRGFDLKVIEVNVTP